MNKKRALISVSDKSGISEFARELIASGVKIISTGGTYKKLKEDGLDVVEISDFTGFPEMLDGRVKTLHPLIHGGILAIRDNDQHLAEMEKNGINPIDFVVVNLYPFEATIAKPNVEMDEAIENIDIGGPTMLRSAAKNYKFVTVVTDPADYKVVTDELSSKGEISAELKLKLSGKVFAHTARYDGLISNYFGTLENKFPKQLNLSFKAKQALRYGENPHQDAYFYSEMGDKDWSTVSNLEQLQGKELSFNNIVDLSAALEISREFAEETFCCVLKHTNPCGASVGSSVKDAFLKAWAGDSVSAFGSIIGFTAEVDETTALEIIKYFVEIVVAPNFSAEAREVFKAKKNLRIMKMVKPLLPYEAGYDYKRVNGGFLIQEADEAGIIAESDLKIVTKKQVDADAIKGLLFSWKMVKHIKSNAICYTNGKSLIGVGAGQMSRVDSAKFGADKAQSSLEGCFLASDAFFPFRDGIDAAAAQGVAAIIQPGGSIRDQEIIDACDEYGIAMVFTGRRHFKH